MITLPDILLGDVMVWVSVCAYFVVLMQLALAWRDQALIRPKNQGLMWTKKLINIVVATLAWYLYGYGLGYGNDKTDGYTGRTRFVGVGFHDTQMYGGFVLYWAYAITACSLIPQATAERLTARAYYLYTLLFVGVIFSIQMHWLTHEDGWLVKRGFVDCGGATFVHFTGGVSAAIASAFIGKRKNKGERHDDTNVYDAPTHVYAVLLLFVCWFGFNGAGALYVED